MNRLRPRLPAIAWVATLALLAMALWPAVSHALAHARGSSTTWVEICTPQGMRLVALHALPADDESAPGVPAPLQAAGHLEHCALCTLAQDTPGLPAEPRTGVPSPAGQAGVHGPPRPEPRVAPAWPDALPRAPPALA